MSLLILRRPDVLTSPKLWGEDGAIFMKDAYLRPFYQAALSPYAGYVHLIPRLWAALSTALPVRDLPASFAVFTLVLDAACLVVVLSPRFAWLIPSFPVRAALFLSLILLPGTSETHGNLTNTIWYTGLCLLLLSFASDPRTGTGRAAEVMVCLLFALTGATSVVVAVLFVLRWRRNRTRHSALVMIVVAAGGLFQFVDLRLHPRPPPDLSSTSVGDWAWIMVERVGGTAAIGQQRLVAWWHGPNHTVALGLGLTLVAATFVIGWSAPSKARLPLGLAMALLLASVTAGTVGAFRSLADPRGGGRYFVTPIALMCVVLAASVPVLLRRLPKRAGWLALTPVAMLAFGMIGDARLTALPPIGWPESAHCIASHRACHVALNPPGWSVDLPPLRSAR